MRRGEVSKRPGGRRGEKGGGGTDSQDHDLHTGTSVTYLVLPTPAATYTCCSITPAILSHLLPHHASHNAITTLGGGRGVGEEEEREGGGGEGGKRKRSRSRGCRRRKKRIKRKRGRKSKRGRERMRR